MVPVPASTGYRAGSTGFPWQIPDGHMCLRSSAMAKMDPSAANMTLAVWNGYVQETCTLVTPRRGRSWMGQDVGLLARARSRSSLCKSSSVSLVDLVLAYGCMLLLKNC